jgi:hypothetical protein
VGTWLNDGIDRIGVWRPSTSQWFLDTAIRSVGTSSSYDPLNTTLFQFGSVGDQLSF